MCIRDSFTSGYIRRAIHALPKQGTKKPWRLEQNYLEDRRMIGKSKVDDGVMVFSAPNKQAVKKEGMKEVVSGEL